MLDYDSVIAAVRAAFLCATAIVLFVYTIRPLRSRFLDYGARSQATNLSSAEEEKRIAKRTSVHREGLLDNLARATVPHNWFTSFYVLSVALSIFWMIVLPVTTIKIRSIAAQLWFVNHPLVRWVIGPLPELIKSNHPSTPFSQALLGCILLLLQGLRRLTECWWLSTPSHSTMWLGHWFMGLAFYAGMSVAIWIEGVPDLMKHSFSIRDVAISAPCLRTSIAVVLFILASGIQHDCHSYLASLKRKSLNSKDKQSHYQLPTFPAFTWTLTPHYLMECIIYLSLSILAAPQGYLLNWTVFCAFTFVLVNLGVTAIGTRQWYERRFGSRAVAGRWAMIPFVL